jgi:hypothetical protein
MAFLVVIAAGKEAMEVRFAEQVYAIVAGGVKNWVNDDHIATVTGLITTAWPGAVVTRTTEA